MASVDIAGCEFDTSEARDVSPAFATDNFFPLLGVPGCDAQHVTLGKIKSLYKQMEKNVLATEKNGGSTLVHVRSLDGKERYVRIKETQIESRVIVLAEDVTAATLERMRIERERDYDLLTGLYNRHYGEIWMKQVKEEARDTGEPFSIAIADIDFFKKFNDCYGHDCGDMVLRKVSELLQTQVGRQGYVSRWGGEEFLIIFKRFTLEESVNFAEEIREKLHRTELRYHNDGFHVTLTIGVAAGDSEKSIESMVKCADCALYEGKRNGRDQVVCEKQKQSV